MNHLPYEEWLLADERPVDFLSPQDLAALKTHLSECEQCESLSEAWRMVEDQLQNSPMVAPKSGFEGRFVNHLAQTRQRRHRRQTIAFFSFAVLAALSLLVMMIRITWPLLDHPELVLLATLAEIIRIYDIVDTLILALGNLPVGSALPTLTIVIALSLWTTGSVAFLLIVTNRFFNQLRRVKT